MLEKVPQDRIKLRDIKQHPWVTENGQSPMMPSEENCHSPTLVSQEEIAHAVQPALHWFSRFVDIMLKIIDRQG